jgi:hypothetical protein
MKVTLQLGVIAKNLPYDLFEMTFP